MSSKLFTTALLLATVVPFGWYTAQGAVKVTDTLHRQNDTIQQLNVETEKLEKVLEVKQEVKEQTKEEVVKTEQAVSDVISERQRLEKELGEN